MAASRNIAAFMNSLFFMIGVDIILRELVQKVPVLPE